MVITKRLTLAFILPALVGILAYIVSDNNFSLEIGAAAAVLILLLTGQFYFILQRIRKRSRPILRDIQSVEETLKQKEKRHSKAEPQSKLPEQINPSVFSRFQESIDQSKQSRNSSSEADDVILSISDKGKKASSKIKISSEVKAGRKVRMPELVQHTESSSPTSAKVKKSTDKPVPTEPIGSLFDDVREPLSPKKETTAREVKRKNELPSKKDDVSEPEETEPLIAHEALTSEDLQPDEAGGNDEADLILSMAKKHQSSGEYEESISIINQFMNRPLTKLSSPKRMKELIQLKGEAEFQLKQYDNASKTWFEIFQKHIKKGDSDFLPMLENTIDKFRNEAQQQYAVHFLFTALNEYRQNQNIQKMDETYHEIENAYQQQEDWSRLIQTYQNHLTIKRSLNDHKGQLDILDHLGKILYDQGDAEGSRKCYEQRLTIETQMGKS